MRMTMFPPEARQLRSSEPVTNPRSPAHDEAEFPSFGWRWRRPSVDDIGASGLDMKAFTCTLPLSD